MLAELSRDEHELLARIAHRSFIDRRTQGEIASEFGMSRPMQRLLDRARSAGVVEIHIDVPPGLDLDLERRLAEAFHLTESVVSPSHPDPESQRGRSLATPPATWSARCATGIRWLSAMVGTPALSPTTSTPRRPSIACSPVRWGSSRVDVPTNPNEISQALAERCGDVPRVCTPRPTCRAHRCDEGCSSMKR